MDSVTAFFISPTLPVKATICTRVRCRYAWRDTTAFLFSLFVSSLFISPMSTGQPSTEGHDDPTEIETQSQPPVRQQTDGGGMQAVPTGNGSPEPETSETGPSACTVCAKEPETFKITAWRALNTLILAAFGVAKTIAAYNGNPSVDAWDMALGLFWAIVCVSCTPL